MPSQITVAQIQGLEQQFLSGSPPNTEGFYQALYSTYGYGYAQLAEGVVSNSNLSGIVAQQYMQNSAALQGVTLTPAVISNIESARIREGVDQQCECARWCDLYRHLVRTSIGFSYIGIRGLWPRGTDLDPGRAVPGSRSTDHGFRLGKHHKYLHHQSERRDCGVSGADGGHRDSSVA